MPKTPKQSKPSAAESTPDTGKTIPSREILNSITSRKEPGRLTGDEWRWLGEEIAWLTDSGYPVLAAQIFLEIETGSLYGTAKLLAERLDNLDKRIEHLERENASLRNRLAWAVKGDR